MKLHIKPFCKKYRRVFGIFLVFVFRGHTPQFSGLFSVFLGYKKRTYAGVFLGKKH